MIGKTIGQYQVIDKIGEGGMGAVYKAEDTTLHRLVALKTLSTHLTEDEEAKERFVREAQAASTLNHPNITTVYEFIEDDDTRLICMEYVEGKTIRDMVESGIVSVRKAIDIITQSAEALEAAHNKGILHRDVKSANIMVNMEGRVKVMDFGLAHLETRSQLTRTGTTMGTLSYSSPEQISGKPVDRRSEIFSLGIVFYELLTGQLPFKAANEAEILFAIINNEPPKIATVREDVPELVEAVVSKMLEKDTDLRYQTCGEVISDLKGIRKEMETSTVGITGVLERIQTSRRKALIQQLAIGIVAVAVVVAGIVLLITGGTKLDPNKIVVAPFENQTGDSSLDPMGLMAAEMVAQGIESTQLVDAYPFRGALQIYKSLQETEGREDTADLLKTLAIETGAGVMISGTVYLLNPETLRFQVDISDMRRDEILRHFEPIDGPRQNPEELIEQLRSKVMGFIASYFDPLIPRSIELTGNSPSYEAYKEYSVALELFRSIRFKEAIPHLYAAASLDTSFIEPLLLVAVAHVNAGEGFAKADSISRILVENREELLPYDRLWLDWLVAWISGNQGASYRAVKDMAEIAPQGDIEYIAGLEARCSNYLTEAVEYFARVDRGSPIMSPWIPYWDQYCVALHMLGDHKKELKVALRGHQQHPELTRGVRNQVYALAALGKVDEVNRMLSTELLLPDESGIWRNTALELREHGYPEAAAEVLDRLIEWYEARPAEEDTTHRINLARTLYLAERWDEALSIYTELNEEDPSSLAFNNYLGLLAARRNDREEAMRYIARLIEIHGMNKYDHGALQYNQACIYSLLGDKEEAVRLLQEAYRKGRTFSLGLLRDIDLEPLRGYPPFEDFIRSKG